MNRSANTATLLLLAVAASALLGLSVILTPGVALPFSIELILLFALTLWGLSREPDPDRSSPELCVKVRGSSSMLRLGCLGDLLGLEE